LPKAARTPPKCRFPCSPFQRNRSFKIISKIEVNNMLSQHKIKAVGKQNATLLGLRSMLSQQYHKFSHIALASFTSC
jgi:hypothetical protein